MNYIKELRKKIGNMPIMWCATGVIIFNEEGQILLQKRSDMGTWDVPGGMLELGEAVEVAAKREILEETGLQVKNLEFFNVYSGESEHCVYPNGDEVYYVNIMFQTNTYTGTLESADGESERLQFFSINNMPKNLTKSFAKIAKDLQNLLD